MVEFCGYKDTLKLNEEIIDTQGFDLRVVIRDLRFKPPWPDLIQQKSDNSSIIKIILNHCRSNIFI